MDTKEALEMMRRASDEIKNLRRINQQLAPKADAYSAICQILDLMPQRSQGMAEDVAWLLDRRIAQIEGEQEAASKQA